MSFFRKFIKRSKRNIAEAEKEAERKPRHEIEKTDTVLRQPDKATSTTKEKERAELTTLEIAGKRDWKVKSLHYGGRVI